MNVVWHCFSPLAQKGGFHNLGDHFRAETATIDLGQLAVLLAIVSLVALAVWYWQRRTGGQGDAGLNSPRRLFQDLCRAHELSRDERKLLWEVPRRLGLDEPGAVFADPTHLVIVVRRAEDAELRRRLERLGVRLFGTLMFRRHLTHCPE